MWDTDIQSIPLVKEIDNKRIFQSGSVKLCIIFKDLI